MCIACAVFGTDQSADLDVFLTAGRNVVHGVNPYVSTSSPTLLDGHAYVYPWLAAWLFTPLSVLPNVVAGGVFTLLGVAAVVAGARLLGVTRGWGTAALILCAPFARNAELGAVNACFFFLLAAMWHWRDRTWVVATSATLLVGVKLFLAPILLWVLLTRTWRCTAATFGAIAGFFAISFWLGPIGPRAYLDLLHRLSNYMGHRGMSFESGVAYFFPSAPARVIVGAVLVVALAMLGYAYLRSGRADHEGVLGSMVLFSLVATPMLWRHYLLLLFFVLAMIRPHTRGLIAAAALSWVVIGSERISPLGGLSLGGRFVLLYLWVACLFCFCLSALPMARSQEGGGSFKLGVRSGRLSSADASQG